MPAIAGGGGQEGGCGADLDVQVQVRGREEGVDAVQRRVAHGVVAALEVGLHRARQAADLHRLPGAAPAPRLSSGEGAARRSASRQRGTDPEARFSISPPTSSAMSFTASKSPGEAMGKPAAAAARAR